MFLRVDISNLVPAFFPDIVAILTAPAVCTFHCLYCVSYTMHLFALSFIVRAEVIWPDIHCPLISNVFFPIIVVIVYYPYTGNVFQVFWSCNCKEASIIYEAS